MITLSRTLALGLLVLASSCSLSLGPIGFDIPYDIPQQQVPGDPTAHAAGVAVSVPPTTFPINVDLAAAAKQNGVSSISSVTLTSLSFTIQPAGSSECFDFVQSVSVSIASTKAGTTLPSQVVATGSSPGCVQTFTLSPNSSVNLKPYIDEGASATLTGQMIPPANTVSFNGSMRLHAAF